MHTYIAAQMWTFAILLPLIIGDLVPEEEPHWECFLLLLQIVKHCTSSRVTSTAASAIIAALIDQHHQNFKKCYSSTALTPKMHYMVHFPQQLLRLVAFKDNNYTLLYIYIYINRIGPLVISWCMRMAFKDNNYTLLYIYIYINRIGPVVISWCMRMEAKNSYFKKVARISNFKNVPYSVAKRHQHLVCAYLQGPFFTFDELQCGPCMFFLR